MITQWASDEGTDAITASIKWGYDEINAALAERYADYLPFTSVPGIVFNFQVTFAIYRLCYRTKDTIQDGSALSKEYDEARERLQKIADGDMPLLLADGTVADDAVSGSSKEADMSPDPYDDDYKPIFSRDSLYNYTERRY